MGKFQNHKQFPKQKNRRDYLFPFVCLTCRKSFKKPQAPSLRTCPQCRGELIALSRKFLPPKADNVKQWEKIAYLVEHGFLFQGIYGPHESGGLLRMKYPETLKEAKQFVEDYRTQAVPKDYFSYRP
ncbi:MAG: hypothetical protein AAFQ63_06375 [Cyanobacteria bacterium J06621_11]